MPSAAATASPLRLPILALFTANATSMTGNQLAMLAIPWFVLATTGSAVKTGLTAFFSILPVVLSAFFGGALVDRVGYKRTSIIADLASGIAVALIPLLYAAQLLEFWMLLALVFLGALLDAPGTTAREALVPDLAQAAGMPLERASSLLQIVERGSRLLGAPLAGILVGTLGAQNVLWLDTATFAVSALLVAVAVPTLRVAPQEQPGSYPAQLREGLLFIRGDRLMLALVLLLVITNFLDAAKSSVILPVLARSAYGSAVALGLMFGLSGGGAVAGALLYGWLGPTLSRRWIFTLGFIVVSLQSLMLAFLPPLPLALIIQALTGLAAGPLNPILSTLTYEHVPANMRGRVFGTITASAFVAMPLGVLVAGYLLDLAGLRPVLLAVGACYLLTTLTLLFNPALRAMDHPAPRLPATR